MRVTLLGMIAVIAAVVLVLVLGMHLEGLRGATGESQEGRRIPQVT